MMQVVTLVGRIVDRIKDSPLCNFFLDIFFSFNVYLVMGVGGKSSVQLLRFVAYFEILCVTSRGADLRILSFVSEEMSMEMGKLLSVVFTVKSYTAVEI